MRRLVLLIPLLVSVACSDSPTGEGNAIAPDFVAPLDGAPRVGNVFDHEWPFEFEDDNGYLRAWWGERVAGIDGHDGYDFAVPEGTPVRAVTDGVVAAARGEKPWTCPLLGQTVSGLFVIVRHRVASGTYATLSLHLSRIDVAVGQRVKAGQTLGLSGNTGCSSAPHLHFATFRLEDDGSYGPVVDPYGWDDAANTDPWALHPLGAHSVSLWRAGAAPPIYNEAKWLLASNIPIGIVRVRWMGVRDSVAPSNEFIDIQVPASTAAIDLTGWSLRMQSGASWTFPAGTVLDGAHPTLRVYSGAPMEAGALGMGMTHGVISNMGDCVVLRSPSGSRYAYPIRQSDCLVPEAWPGGASLVMRAAIPEPRDVRNSGWAP